MPLNRREFNYGLALSLGLFPFHRFATQNQLRIDLQRLFGHLMSLASFGKNPEGGVSRVAYSEADQMGRRYVQTLMKTARLDVTIDAAGNLIGRRAGSDKSLKPLLMGSHIDSVPEGGNFDGVVGSLGAIEVAQVLAENNVTLRHPLEVVIFQNEEGGLIGSRAIDGELTEKELDLVSRSGKTIREGIKFIGGDPTKLSDVRRNKGDIATYLELHIEQGGALEPMPSGAGHDAQDMARLGPVGMIFVPSIGGISHSPKEASNPSDVGNGANVLLHTLLKLDNEKFL